MHPYGTKGYSLGNRSIQSLVGLLVLTVGQYACIARADLIQQAKLNSMPEAGGDSFAFSVSISGDSAVVGASGSDVYAGNGGAAYVFVRNNAIWTQQAPLFASDASPGDGFGQSVSIRSDTTLVGAPSDDGIGSAYVFSRSGTSWIQQAKLVADDRAPGDAFGQFVSVTPDYALVGSRNDDHSGATGAGSAYVFQRNGSQWQQQVKLIAPPSDVVNSQNFGYSVSVRGDDAIVGAIGDGELGFRAGAAYVFHRDGANWELQDKLLPPISDASNVLNFGVAVSISGDTALVGAHGVDAGYFFHRNGAQWQLEDRVTANGANFGGSVVIDGDFALVGAQSDDAGGGPNSGAAYLFRRTGTDWNLLCQLAAADAASGDAFGISVGLSGDSAIVGAYGDTDFGVESGSAYVFAGVPEPSTWVLAASGFLGLLLCARRRRRISRMVTQ